MAEWVNVKDAPYNAAGNGIADDFAAVQSAATAAASVGKAVYFPKGTYKLGNGRGRSRPPTNILPPPAARCGWRSAR